jgi:hypothetical protein
MSDRAAANGSKLVSLLTLIQMAGRISNFGNLERLEHKFPEVRTTLGKLIYSSENVTKMYIFQLLGKNLLWLRLFVLKNQSSEFSCAFL